MANRILKESICTSETLAAVSPEAERLWWRIVAQADDFGRFEARPEVVLGQCLTAFIGRIPVSRVSTWLQELQSAGLLFTYQVNGKPFLQIKTWDKHQRRRAQYSKYPQPPEADDSGGQVTATADNGQQMPADVGLIRGTRNEERDSSSEVGVETPPSDLESKEPQRYGSDSEEYKLAEQLRARILENNHKARVPDLESKQFQLWCNDLRLMRDRDGREAGEIARVVDWCQSDEFWRSNILSPGKLRKQYDTLVLRMPRARAQLHPPPAEKDPFAKTRAWRESFSAHPVAAAGELR